MIPKQRNWVWSGEKTIYEHGERRTPFVDGLTERDTHLRLVCETMAEASKCKEESHERAGSDESKEVAIVPASNTVVEPNTVMV